MKTGLRSSILAVAVLLAAAASARHVNAQGAPAGSSIETVYPAILADPRVGKALEDIKANDARTLAEQKHITEIPAPPFKEQMRAEY